MRCEPCQHRDVHLGNSHESRAEMIQTESIAMSDAMMAAVLANSNWAKMEREARMFSLLP